MRWCCRSLGLRLDWISKAVPRYEHLAARAPAAYQEDAARHGIRSEAALWLTEELQGVSPGFRPTTQGQLQEELERQAAALEEDIRQLRDLLAADRKRAIKDFWRRHAPDIAQRWKAVRGAIEVEAPGPVRPLERAGPQHPNGPHGGPRRDVRSSRLLARTV